MYIYIHRYIQLDTYSGPNLGVQDMQPFIPKRNLRLLAELSMETMETMARVCLSFIIHPHSKTRICVHSHNDKSPE